MIRVLILYYLNTKPTHGYEIQKFIKYTQLDSWTKIQSGSIYYALDKLEKEGMISLVREESIGSKVRKIFNITDEGTKELERSIAEELQKDIHDVGSGKFILYPFLNCMDKEQIANNVNLHIKSLKEKKDYFEKWQKIKIQPASLQVEVLSFEMIVSSLDYQIKWHTALLQELDECQQLGRKTEDFIRKVDFSTVNEEENTQIIQQQMVERLKQEILTQPSSAEEKLEELIKILKK
ncbi:MAG: transcriptional regulator, PadR family [Eubacterium sp.]|jgi:DNA-binding PadR family transcriptional regulator|nr:transcriptional regulator, PadR family [Eubacterium sp.]